jgi:hypothetical protein
MGKKHLGALITGLVWAACNSAGAGAGVFLLGCFKGSGETAVHPAASEEGRTLRDLNEGRPIFTPLDGAELEPPAAGGRNLSRITHSQQGRRKGTGHEEEVKNIPRGGSRRTPPAAL